MKMCEYIEYNLEDILEEWDEHASRQRPASIGMSRDALRNLAEAILRAVVTDARSAQSEEARHQKSLGGRPPEQPRDVIASARDHAAERLGQGFGLNQLLAEYRALRASVIRRWRAETTVETAEQVEELTRFNEALDESLAEAVSFYHARIEDARELLNGVLAHDLRTPLAAVLTSAEVLLRDEQLDARELEVVVRLRNSAIRMQSMVDDLLDFTRTRLGTGLPMAVESCDMFVIIEAVVEEQRAYHPGASIRDEASGDLTGAWDRSRIEQMLANLIDNAVEHGGDAPITIAASGDGDRVRITIHDEGGTISEDEQRVIFDPLRRAALRQDGAVSQGAGLGLGLYIARQIAEAHDGSVEVESSRAEGTTFTIELPRERDEGAETTGLT